MGDKKERDERGKESEEEGRLCLQLKFLATPLVVDL